MYNFITGLAPLARCLPGPVASHHVRGTTACGHYVAAGDWPANRARVESAAARRDALRAARVHLPLAPDAHQPHATPAQRGGAAQTQHANLRWAAAPSAVATRQQKCGSCTQRPCLVAAHQAGGRAVPKTDAHRHPAASALRPRLLNGFLAREHPFWDSRSLSPLASCFDRQLASTTFN